MTKSLERIRSRAGSLAASASATAALFVISLVFAASASAYEGFGYQTQGGQGGSTCHVTTLASSGSGSLYDCVVIQAGARTVVFDVSGTITPADTLSIRDPYLTVDGTTAPAPGITIRPPSSADSAFVIDNTHDVIIRGLRLVGYNPSGSVENGADLVALDGTSGEIYNVVIDHLSLTAADDGAVDITGNVHDVTVSWCLLYGNGLTSLIKYDTRQRISIHHNVYAHNAERNPQVKGDMRTFDFRNNIVYDWTLLSYGYGLRLWSAPSSADSPGIPSVNVVGNAFIAKTTSGGCGIDLIEDSSPVQRWVADNFASPSPLCLSSNLSAPLSIPAAAQVNTSPSSALASVVLPTVGLTPHNSTEQALLDAISARLPSSSTYTLSVTSAGTGSGVVSSSPAGISCGADCSEPYASGTVVTLTATPASGSTFAGWSGACSGTAACTVTMNGAASVTATFDTAGADYALTVAKAGSGSGTVSSSPAGVNCGSACSASYSSGTVVTLAAAADTGSTFAGWSGACPGTAACTVTMSGARSVTATFNTTAPASYTVSVIKSGSGSGTVSSSPAGINCGTACSASYPAGTVVTLTAAAASGSTFGGWSGACSGTGSCTPTMSAARSVTATFNTSSPPPPSGGHATYGNGGNPWAISSTTATRIQTENFDQGGEGVAYHDSDSSNSGGAYRATGVDLQSASGGGYNVGWIAAGEWLEYTVNVAAAGTYNLRLHVARAPAGTSLVRVLFGGADKTGDWTVPSTGGWQSWTNINKTVTLAAGVQVVRIAMIGSLFNVDYFELAPATGTSGRQTYGGNGGPWPIGPATVRIQAENFDTGGEGVAFHDSSATNEGGQYRSTSVDIESTSGGGYNVGWIAAGEWLEYTVNVASTGTYTLHLRVARSPSGNGAVKVLFGGVDKTGDITVPSTGGWQTWTDVVKTVSLPAGAQVMRIAMRSSDFNVDWIEVTPGTN